MVFDPNPSSFIDKGHEVSSTIVLMVSVGPVIIVSFVHDDSDESILSCGFRVLEWLEPKFMIDVSVEEDMVEEHVMKFHVAIAVF